MSPYAVFLLYLLAILGFVAVTLLLNRVLGPKPIASALKLEPFECGATPVDTRNVNGSFGGPALAAGAIRSFPLATSACAVPADAKAVAVNVTVTQPGAAGTVAILPSGAGAPQTTTVAFPAGKTRAGSAVVGVAAGGTASVSISNGSASTTHVLIDVAGYFQ